MKAVTAAPEKPILSHDVLGERWTPQNTEPIYSNITNKVMLKPS